MEIVARIIEKLRLLKPSQLERVERLVDTLAEGCTYEANAASDIATERFCEEFGDTLRQHHAVSAEAFTKDKFEYAMVGLLNADGRAAEKAPTGNPGHDLTVDGVPWSLKTQADANIRAAELHISKYMELGRGEWSDESHLAGLRDRMLAHMRSYDRIFDLRCLSRGSAQERRPYIYELVEIPKSLLEECIDGDIAMMHNSRQTPKPGTCSVYDANTGRLKYELYFDGGTERKLQVRKLNKAYCTVHVTWTFIPGE
jgi:hypothetical protein